MRLLTPSNVRDIRQEELRIEAVRINELNDASEKARKNLANAEADFSDALAGQRQRWADEELAHSKRTAEMQAELTILEAARAKALEPIEIMRTKAEKQIEEASAMWADVMAQDRANEEVAELLQDKLDAVGQREIDVAQAERQLKLQQESARKQYDSIQAQAKALSASMLQFRVDRQNGLQELEERHNKLTLWEQSLKAKESQLERTAKSLEALRLKLKDERGIIERMYIRAGIVSPYKKPESEGKI